MTSTLRRLRRALGSSTLEPTALRDVLIDTTCLAFPLTQVKAGPVVANVTARDDSSIRAAAAVALAAKEHLVIVHAHEGVDPRIRELAVDAGLTIKDALEGRAAFLIRQRMHRASVSWRRDW